MLRFDPTQDTATLTYENHPKAYIIMDGQWGSCGKGLLSGVLALEKKPDAVVCNFGPNAGHTFIDSDGNKIMTQQLPIGMVHLGAMLLIGPGAVIDPKILEAELKKYNLTYDLDRRLMIHESAAVVSEHDKEQEQILQEISSTRKGVGAANSKKMMRVTTSNEPLIARDSAEIKNMACVINDQTYQDMLMNCDLIQIESAQGFELSLNRSLSYPYTTSRDITPEQILNDCAIPRRWLDDVYVVVRTFPIRVGNEYDQAGKMVGFSGPVYKDMKELSWTDISNIAGQSLEEKTTVTQKVRRIFSWSDSQFERMLGALAPAKIMLNYCNYLEPDAIHHDNLNTENQKFIERVEKTALKYGSNLEYLGFGPSISEVFSHNEMKSDKKLKIK